MSVHDQTKAAIEALRDTAKYGIEPPPSSRPKGKRHADLAALGWHACRLPETDRDYRPEPDCGKCRMELGTPAGRELHHADAERICTIGGCEICE